MNISNILSLKSVKVVSEYLLNAAPRRVQCQMLQGAYGTAGRILKAKDQTIDDQKGRNRN